MRLLKHWPAPVAQAVSEFQSLLAGLAEEMQTRIDRLVATLLARLDQSELLAFVTDAVPALLLPFLAAVADLTTVWYDEQAPKSDFSAIPADLAPSDQLAAMARWAMLQPDPAGALGGSATRALFDASRETVIVNAEREGVRWARHAAETACGFCRMLATLGFHYRSEATAKSVRHTDAQGHDHCNCTVIPERGATYTPPAYLEQWKRDYKTARRGGAKTAGQIANAMDYLPGGRRYKADSASREVRPKPPVNLDSNPAPSPADTASGNDSKTAARLLPGLEKSLAALRKKGLPENSPQIQYHVTTIARLRRQLQTR